MKTTDSTVRFYSKSLAFSFLFFTPTLVAAIVLVGAVFFAKANVAHAQAFIEKGYLFTNNYKKLADANWTNQQISISGKAYRTRNKKIANYVSNAQVYYTMRSNTLLAIDPNVYVQGANVISQGLIYKGVATFFIQSEGRVFGIGDAKGNTFVTIHALVDEQGPTIKLISLTPTRKQDGAIVFGMKGELAVDINDRLGKPSELSLWHEDKRIHLISIGETYTADKAVANISQQSIRQSLETVFRFKVQEFLSIQKIPLSENTFTITILGRDQLGNETVVKKKIAISLQLPKIEVFKQQGEEISLVEGDIVVSDKKTSFFLISSGSSIFYAVSNANSQMEITPLLFQKQAEVSTEKGPDAISIANGQTLYYYAVNRLGNRSPLGKVTLLLGAPKNSATQAGVKVR